jgi:hypothetical protein
LDLWNYAYFVMPVGAIPLGLAGLAAAVHCALKRRGVVVHQRLAYGLLILAIAPAGFFPLVYLEEGQQWGLPNLIFPSVFVVTSAVVLFRARVYVAFGISHKIGETVSERPPTAQLPRLSRANLVGLLWFLLAAAVIGLFGLGQAITTVATTGFEPPADERTYRPCPPPSRSP